MGRMRRQRKYKSCDPFSKEVVKKNDGFDRPPKLDKFDDEHFSETKSVKKFKKLIGISSKEKPFKNSHNLNKHNEVELKKKKSKQNKVKDVLKTTLPRQPNETRKQYFQRLDENIQNAANEAIKDQHRIRPKRKEHLKARDEKRKGKVNSEEVVKDFKSLKDEVLFGEVVNEPPTINFKPRKSGNQSKSFEPKPSNLILSSLLDNNTKYKKRKNMSSDEIDNHDKNRQAAIDAYRLMKKRKESNNPS